MSARNPTEATGLHPTVRPAEKRQDIEFQEKDAALRHDVHKLAAMIGDLLKEQGGDSLFDVVEAARRTAIDRREGDGQAGANLDALVQSLSPLSARNFVRAFSTYFQVVNTAEQVHRIRRWRDYIQDSSTRQPGGIEETIFRLRDAGLSLDDVLKLFHSLHIEPVFAADSIEPTRRTILRKQQNIVKRLVEIQNPVLTPPEVNAYLQSIRSDITTIWQTEEHPHEERTVFDEVEHILFFLTDVIYRAIPSFYERIANSLQLAYGDEAAGVQLPTILRFSSWIGSDFEARPDITGRTIRETLARQRSLNLDLYFNEVRALAQKLSQSTGRISVSEEMLKRTQQYAKQFPGAAGQVSLRYRDMPYRAFLKLVEQRLQATFDDDVFPYESADEFRKDMQLVHDSLAANRGMHAGLFSTRRLITRIKTFGFYFLTLDIRQSAIINRRVLGHCLGERNWLDQTPQERTQRLQEALENNESPSVDPNNQARRTLAIFQAIAFCRRRYGKRSIGPYIISMAHGVDDVLSVLLLARWADLRKKNGGVPLDITPYFETNADLVNCSSTMHLLLQNDIYRRHLERCDNHQIIMVSYSDTNRDVGIASARWSLHQAQSDLVTTMDKADVKFTLFHGRGGTISRGGGRTHAAVLDSPPGTIRGRLRATEQGELVNAKYGVRGIALRTLEQTMSSVAMATALPRQKTDKEQGEWHRIMETITTASATRYQHLIYDSDNFFDYFQKATPVDVIMRMREVERAALPNTSSSINNLHGVPWDHAWIQSRHILPGWYGFGTGLTAAIKEFGLAAVQEMAESWYFFRAVLYDVETVLAKTDLNIASRYSALAGDLHDQFFPHMRTEFELSVEQILILRNQQVLLEKQATLRRSIRLRNPYVDPMSLLQVDLLRRWRAVNREDAALFDALIASINGIARGLQDSG
ncbi:MAG: phosphoenolpyruvate carboxylase [Gammaproteobacteria bacterium]|nr:phosphoenolpyruvate carboxylase [Gammaproteobacteria bacterium]